MKLKDLKTILSKASEKLVYTQAQQTSGNREYVKFSDLRKFRQGITILEKSGLFGKEIKQISNSTIFTTTSDTIRVEMQEGTRLIQSLDNLKLLVDSISNTLINVVGEVKENTVSIKLPRIKDFEDLAKASEAFHKVINQAIVNEQINGRVEIENVENGSIWFDIYVGSAIAVTLIGGLAWAAAVIFKKIQEGRIIVEHVKSLKVKSESLKEIKDKQKEALTMLIDAEAQNLYNENFEGADSEQIERLKHSIKLLADLIDKGAEIHPALNQPEKVTNLFPDMKNLLSLESKIKKLN